jgi:hypothetical protein
VEELLAVGEAIGGSDRWGTERDRDLERGSDK